MKKISPIYPERIFSISDCHGGSRVWHPYHSPDVVEQLSQSIRSDFSELRRFDNFGSPTGYDAYIVRMALHLHEHHQPTRSTGLFINSAPRTKKDNNGQPFYLAEFDHDLRVVVTPLSALSQVKHEVRRLRVLPNEDNGLYNGTKEQHRSSYTPKLLADNHGLSLVDVDISTIPDPSPTCELSYVDRFGNMVISGYGDEFENIRKTIRKNKDESITVCIGAKRRVKVGQSLSQAEAGGLVIYDNDGDIEILSKWSDSWTATDRLKNSAYSQFREPAIGTEVYIKS